MGQPATAGAADPLRVYQLYKDYRLPNGAVFHAVKGVSFSIGSGECFGLVGPNGAGKSTVINCISGFYPPTSGDVRIMGEDVHANPKSARSVLGICPQEDTLDTDFSVFDQMARHATYFRISYREAKERARELLCQFGLEEKMHAPVESLSGGMRRRLQVARAFVSWPKVLILDEPTTGLDPEVRRLLWEIIGGYRKKGAAILLSTHYMEEAERLCDRVAIIHDGKILDIAPPPNLVERHIGKAVIEEEVRPGVSWKRPPNLEDVFLKLTGKGLGE